MFAGNSRKHPDSDFTWREVDGRRVNILHDTVRSGACNSHQKQANHGPLYYWAFPSLIWNGKVRNANIYYLKVNQSHTHCVHKLQGLCKSNLFCTLDNWIECWKSLFSCFSGVFLISLWKYRTSIFKAKLSNLCHFQSNSCLSHSNFWLFAMKVWKIVLPYDLWIKMPQKRMSPVFGISSA